MKLALVLVAVASCSEHDRAEVKRDPERVHRVIEPPSRGVRALPPHAIRSDGVGPYRLGASLAELLDQLPSGPRIAQFDIPGVVHRSILRAEDDTILIGGEPQGRASFVAVVGADIARTESGIHVGSTRDQLVQALGGSVDDVDHARDPRIVVPSGLRDAHVVLDGDRVVAIVVTTEDQATGDARITAPDSGCTRPTSKPGDGRFGACLTAAGELVTVDGDDLGVHAVETERPPGESRAEDAQPRSRVIAATRVPGLVFAAALRAPDGRDELVAIARTQSEDAAVRTWSLVAFRLDGNRLVKTIESTPLYQLTVTNARWIGAELAQVDILLELTSRDGAIDVGGLLTTRIGDQWRDIVVISPVRAPRRRAKSSPAEPTGAGPSDTRQ